MTAQPTTRIEWFGTLQVHQPVKQRSRTWCGMYLCCRERSHAGACEVDITMLTDAELGAIEESRTAA